MRPCGREVALSAQFRRAVYRRALREGRPDVRPELHGARGAGMLDPGGLHEVRDVEGSKALDGQDLPSVVVSASGMITGGRCSTMCHGGCPTLGTP